MFQKKNPNAIPEEYQNARTIIAKGTLFEGNLETFGIIRIDGKLIGILKCKSKVFLGDSSKMEGNVLANTAEIEGEITGVLEISDTLILKATAVVNGDIIANKLIIETGAIFNGKCKMGAVVKEIKLGEKVEPHGPQEKSA